MYNHYVKKDVTGEDIRTTPEPLAEKEKQLLALGKLGLKSIDDKHPLEAFIYFSQMIESIMLPMLVYKVMKKLKIQSHFNQFTKLNFSNQILFYLALTQDEDLFVLLENFRRKRNNLVHNLIQLTNLDQTNKQAKEANMSYLKVFEGIDDREQGKIPIPVLTYYTKGYNQRGQDIRERLKKDFK